MTFSAHLARRLAAVSLVLPGLCTAAPDKPVMTWLMQDFPPLAKPVNGKPTDGVTDVLLRMIVQQWPQVEHRYVVSNVPRAVRLAELSWRAALRQIPTRSCAFT